MQVKYWVVFGVIFLCVLLGVSCTPLRGISSITYTIRVEKDKEVTEGVLSLRVAPQASGEVQLTITSSFGGEEFSTSLTASEDSWLPTLLPALTSNPVAGPFLGAIAATQAMYALVESLAGENLKEGFSLREKDAEGRETSISISSGETRFGRETLWIEVWTSGEGTLKFLIEKKTSIPLVIDLLEESGERTYLEATEVTWKEEA